MKTSLVGISFLLIFSILCKISHAQQAASASAMHLNQYEYLENQGVNVMLAHDFYPEGHQGGVGVIQNGMRVATNGDIRLEPTPGQWAAIPKVGKRMIDWKKQEISVQMEYPDSSIDRKGFNPIIYPDLHFKYTIRIVPAGEAFRIIVDLDKPLPNEWIGKVGFNFELFPGALFGKSYYMDQQFGVFSRQANDQIYKESDGSFQANPIAKGHVLTIAPESEQQRMFIENEKGEELQLLDGRDRHNNGWFVVRSLVSKGASKNAIVWLVTPHAIKGWRSDPVVQVSQVGYHPKQQKIAVIELDRHETKRVEASLLRIGENGEFKTSLQAKPSEWGDFLRYHYLQFDFSAVQEPGMYVVRYGKYQTNVFQIGKDVYKKDVWQPTLEYFLPVQMCHMRVNDKYRVWHGWCHMDDARMAPIDSNHFDGYIQGPSTLTTYRSGETVTGLNHGGWHDAGDFDLRVESQSETVLGLTLAYEQFAVNYDNTSINQQTQVVEIQQPDGKPDILQQIEHGLLSIIGGYKSMGRFYRGIIEPTLRQYTLLGDPANMSDNRFFNEMKKKEKVVPAIGLPGSADDRWVFTEDNPARSLEVASALAAASRVMKGFNDSLSQQCLQIAEAVWKDSKEKDPLNRVALAVELLTTTKDKIYADFLIGHTAVIADNISRTGWLVGKTFPLINDQPFKKVITDSVKSFYNSINEEGKKTPYGIPYKPNIWGAGWDIQHFGYEQYFLHLYFPGIVGKEYMLDAINFVLGCHPGSNTASFISGVGAQSMTTAYGFNRADWSYIPGGITSGTALIRPDFPELMKWPFLWQQGEYVLGGGTTDYLFLVLAADHILNEGGDEAGRQDKTGDGVAKERLVIAGVMENSLKKELLDKWYPRSVDSLYGGFLSSFTYDFKPTGPQDKMIVTQARHTWVNAKAAERYPGVEYYKSGAKQGFLFLKNTMWDKDYGGFYTFIDRKGNVKKGNFAEKEAYGNAFGIYALAAYYKSSGDTSALNLARQAFLWLEKHSHDPVYKGYFQHMQRDGTPVKRTADIASTAETGYKDQNSSIHLLEAFTELYSVWKDGLVRERLGEMLSLIQDKMITPKGDLVLFFHSDWTPVSFRDSSRASILKHRNLDHVSFGHDVETAYLMLEATHALGNENDTMTLHLGKRMVDHALRNGWDSVLGGFYDEGYYFKGDNKISIIRKSKNWWAQAEGLNSLLLLSDYFPEDALHYYEKFKLLWQYIQTYLIDHEYGDWYEEGLDKEPQRKTALKGHIWKATYHHYRALDNCIRRLRK